MYIEEKNNLKRIFLSITVLLFVTAIVVEGRKCPGYCTSEIQSCKNHGGKIIAFCKSGQACCNVSDSKVGTCGDRRKGMNATYFKSPSFPYVGSGELACEFKLELEPTSDAVRIDFILMEMDGMKFGGKSIGQCDADSLFIRGFTNWTPPSRCGNLTGYSTIIDRQDLRAAKLETLSILALVSSSEYRWFIRITQAPWKGKKFSTEKSKNMPVTDPPYTSDSYGPIQTHGDYDDLIDISERYGMTEATILADEEDDTEVMSSNNNTFQSRNASNWKLSSIVNGEDTKISKVPWQVSLREDIDPITANLTNSENCTIEEGRHFCGGSILDDRHILSASHCFFGNSKLLTVTKLSSIKIVVGDTNRCVDDEADPTSTEYRVENIIFHYGFDDIVGNDDVVVLRLNDSIKFSRTVQPIKLAPTNSTFTGKEVLLSGWGMANNSEDGAKALPRILQSSNNIIIENRNTCLSYYEEYIEAPVKLLKSNAKYAYAFDSLICTGVVNGTLPVKAGSGDSGGPLVIFKDKDPIQVGIVSYSMPTDEKGKPENMVDFYQSVAFYNTWIKLATKVF